MSGLLRSAAPADITGPTSAPASPARCRVLVIVTGLGPMALASGALLPLGVSAAYRGIAGQLLVLGFGLGLVVRPLTSTLLRSVDRARSGVAAGSLFATRQSGSVIGVALFGAPIADTFRSCLRTSLLISRRHRHCDGAHPRPLTGLSTPASADARTLDGATTFVVGPNAPGGERATTLGGVPWLV